MSEEIRDVTTVVFSGPRFEDAGLDIDVLPDLIVYRKLLVEMAKELWRAENRGRQRLPKGFEESIRLKFYSIEKGSAAVPNQTRHGENRRGTVLPCRTRRS